MKSFFISLWLSWWFTSEAARLRKTSETLCTFQEKKYHPGDSWHPYLEPHGLMFCIRCTCSQTGSINCVSIKCPTPPCENPVTETQQCCPKCLEPKTPAGLRAKQKSCHHNGVIYQAGEMFTSNDLFPLRRPNQCVLCSCSNGNIFCGLKTCLTLTCATPVSLPDTCCQVCKDSADLAGNPSYASSELIQPQLNRGVRHSQNQCFGAQAKGKLVKTSHSTVSNTPRGINLKSFMHKGAAGTTMKIVLQEKHKRACTYSGKTYSHGEVWHPVLRPHRILECILCTCKDGIQECKKMACPSEYPCEYPVKIEGKCCKTCPELKEEDNKTQCPLDDINSLLVYKDESTYLNGMKKIAVEKEGTEEIEVFIWKTGEGSPQVTEVHKMQKKEFAELPENFTLMTRINEDVWKMFVEKEAKNKEFNSRMCIEGNKEILAFLLGQKLDRLCGS
ncbi:chordin-like protein 2 [Erpetoichthys calabaricus]|uniref:chordin-like protein 2 n=1 Tax=Erpetoichthys calabaricus TaxID=27687 RepID=UPI0010A0B7D3|nr:chordin-like protein 2 [Erpetoichthys calabaricus]